MATQTQSRRRGRQALVTEDYDVVADAKKRISLRNAKTRYFHVMALSDGRYVLEPRVLVPPGAIPARTMRMLEQSMHNLTNGLVGKAIDLSGL